MHLIEPYYLWRDYYTAEDDPESLTYGKVYNEFHFTDQIYNFVIHPQWDSFGSETLYFKQLFTDYDQGFCVIELIGEWNDAINNDVMYLKNELIDILIELGIQNFILIVENVLNFHTLDKDYYQEWNEEIEGDIYFVNAQQQVIDELNEHGMSEFIQYDGPLNDLMWRKQKPDRMMEYLSKRLGRLEDFHSFVEL
ncbi:MAG: hypothetical protein JXR19_06845 [Bacteroidia bacterium]